MCPGEPQRATIPWRASAGINNCSCGGCAPPSPFLRRGRAGRGRRPVHAAAPRGLGLALLAAKDCPQGFATLFIAEFRAPSARPAERAGVFEAAEGPLPDHGPLELREGPEHVREHPAGRRLGLDAFGEASEGRPGPSHPLQDGEEVLERPGHAVELPDDEGVARPQPPEEPLQAGTVPPAARGLLPVDLPASGGPEGLHLRPDVLGVPAGDARVSDQHSPSRYVPARRTLDQTLSRNGRADCRAGDPRRGDRLKRRRLRTSSPRQTTLSCHLVRSHAVPDRSSGNLWDRRPAAFPSEWVSVTPPAAAGRRRPRPRPGRSRRHRHPGDRPHTIVCRNRPEGFRSCAPSDHLRYGRRFRRGHLASASHLGAKRNLVTSLRPIC